MDDTRENLTEYEKDALEFENGVAAFKRASIAFHKEIELRNKNGHS